MWVPIVQEDGTNGGLWNATINTTTKVLAERRLATVREMGERTCTLDPGPVKSDGHADSFSYIAHDARV